MAQSKPRKMRETTLAHVDRGAPAYRIIYGVFGGPAKFVRATGFPKGTVHRWVVNGIIPASRQPQVRTAAERERLKLDPALFVPAAAPDIQRDVQIREVAAA